MRSVRYNVDIFQQKTTRNTPQKLATPTDSEDEETPDYYSNPSDELPILQPDIKVLYNYMNDAL